MRSELEASAGGPASVCGIRLEARTQRDLVEMMFETVDRGIPRLFVPMYAHCINVAQRDHAFREVLRSDECVPYADGMAVVWASRLRGTGVPERCTTTDLFPLIMQEAASRGTDVFYLGAGPGVARRCAERMRARFPGLRIAGVRDGFFDQEASHVVIEEINRSGASIVLVGMGMPFQEKWVAEHRRSIDAPAVLTCGASFDFHSGRVRRAPAWMRRSGLEWLFRLLIEPRRLWRRYLIGNLVFIANVIRGAREPRAAAGSASDAA